MLSNIHFKSILVVEIINDVEYENLRKLEYWSGSEGLCQKEFWSEIFDKASPVNRANIYHTGNTQHT